MRLPLSDSATLSPTSLALGISLANNLPAARSPLNSACNSSMDVVSGLEYIQEN